MDEKLKTRIAELTAERDMFVQEANAQIAYYNGQIAALQELVDSATTSDAAEAADADVGAA